MGVRQHRFECVLALAATALLCAGLRVLSAAEQEAKLDPKADAVMRQLSDYYAGLRSFTTTIDLLTKIEFGDEKQEGAVALALVVRKPDRMSMELKSDMGALSMFYDGKGLTTYVPANKTYSVRETAGGLEMLLASGTVPGMNLTGTPGGVSPASLVAAKPYESIMQGVVEGKHLGSEKVDGVPCHHMSFVGDLYDWEVWVAEGKAPLVRRLVPDLSKVVAAAAAEQPQMKGLRVTMTVAFKDWKPDAQLADERFTFTPPADAKKFDLSDFRPPGADAGELLGKPAPAFKLPLLDKREMDVASHKGKNVVILDFWATWCDPCRKVMPIIIEVAKKFEGKGVVLYAVNQGEDAEPIRKFLQAERLSVNVALDEDQSVGEKYGVQGIPQTVLIGKDGTVQAVHVGLLPDLKERLTRELETLTAGKSLVE